MRKPTWLTRATVQWIGLLAGPLLAMLAYLGLPESYQDTGGQTVGFTHAGRATAAVGVWMAIWWMTEAIPIYATALLPLALLPALQAVTIQEAARPYGHELIFLFMGGFIVGLAMQRWNLHRRIAVLGLRQFSADPRLLVGGFMLVSAGLSMWVSNTATTIMMLPIATSIIEAVRGKESEGSSSALPEGEGRNFALCLLLGIAYAASIGGIGTLIGTPPNLFLASYARDQLGIEISFVRWMGIGLPLVVLFLPLTRVLMTRVLYPIRLQRLPPQATLGRIVGHGSAPMGAGERTTLAVFVLMAAAWVCRPLLAEVGWGGARPFAGLSDAGIAMIAAVTLFVIPVRRSERIFVMDWSTAVRLPWGLLVLFGGGLSLAAAIQKNGVGEFIGHQMGGLRGVPPLLIVLVVTLHSRQSGVAS